MNASRERAAQRIDSCMDVRACAGVAGKGVHSSSTMVIVASSRCWISIERAGVRRCLEPSRCDWKVTPSASSVAQLGQRHDLEAAGIRQDRPRPVHEAVQSAEPRDTFGARPQHQVVGVAEHDPGSGRAHRVRGHRLHGAGGADRHEGGCGHVAMCRVQQAGACGPVGGDDAMGEAGVTSPSSWPGPAVSHHVPTGTHRHTNRSDIPLRSRARMPYASARCRQRRRPA